MNITNSLKIFNKFGTLLGRPFETGLECGAHPSRLDNGEIHAKLGDLLANRFGKAFESPFRGVVRTADGERDLAADARNLDDPPAALLAHGLEKGARDLNRGHQVEGDLILHLCVSHLLRRTDQAAAGIVDDDVDPSRARGSEQSRG